MPIAEDLLAGPRGRRFCWELVRATVREQPDDDTLFWASYWTSVRRGEGVSLFGPGASEPRPAPSDDRVVAAYEALLDAADPGSATLDQALAALGRTAGSAMWWQAPDTEDALLDTVVPTSLLERTAASVAAASGVERLLTADGPDRQWCVTPEAPGYGGPARPAPELLAEWRRETVAERSHGRRAAVTAPISGTWWTTPPGGLLETTPERGGRGPLGLWAVEDHTGWERAEVAPALVGPSANTAVVDDAGDWAALCRRFPLDVTATARRHDWYRATGRDGDWVVPDWAAVAQLYDAVRLTLRGWLRASGTAIPVDGSTASVIAGWTPGTTAWLRDPRPALGPAETWRWSDDRESWFRD
ncbi:hypothetical protein DEJ23_00990 [Curtobacterium sp. MCSS17_008]|uniref:hypothetical protein n=1 Tax=Curtobacterium sp. MCSS17_008 TaxID=2175647 RepID=UPI000DA9D428|nr:hypothetical protein [Curtobacterium sp. MCSS17_008]PZF59644.1 hypothetical protein DEJ23_00990 [Curtobacterium sp. MCSS17_008]